MAPKLNLPTRAPGGEDFGREVFSFTAGIKTPFWVNGLKTKARHRDDAGPHQRNGQTGLIPVMVYNAERGSIARALAAAVTPRGGARVSRQDQSAWVGPL